MGKLLDNLRLQLINLEAIEDQLEGEPDLKRDVDCAIDELEMSISAVADALSEDELDEDELDEED